MRRMMVCIAVLATLIAPAWAVNKCTGANGKVVYQEAACDAATKTVAQIKTWDAAISSTEYDSRIRQATAACGIGKLPDYPDVGWSEDKFRQCCVMSLGPAPVINRTETAVGTAKQYVFDYYKAYVYVRGGKVVAIQRQQK